MNVGSTRGKLGPKALSISFWREKIRLVVDGVVVWTGGSDFLTNLRPQRREMIVEAGDVIIHGDASTNC